MNYQLYVAVFFVLIMMYSYLISLFFSITIQYDDTIHIATSVCNIVVDEMNDVIELEVVMVCL